MIKNLIKTLILLVAFVVIILLIFNFRYSFYPTRGTGWSIGYQEISSPLTKFDLQPFKILNSTWLNRLTSQNTRFLADPFIIYEDNEYFIFFEHQAEGNANIALLKSGDGKNFEYMGEVLEEDFHLSFPQVFKFNGHFYMLPETKQSGNVLLYIAENFPFNWKVYDTLIKNVALQDPAILISDSSYLISGRSENLTQYVYTADSLHGKWSQDARFKLRKGDETRAAGNFFTVEGRWFIPFQKNNNGYGSGVSLYEIIIEKEKIRFNRTIDSYLDKSDIIESFNKGMHHFSVTCVASNYFCVFDGDKLDLSKPKTANWKASVKYNYYDIIDFLSRSFTK